MKRKCFYSLFIWSILIVGVICKTSAQSSVTEAENFPGKIQFQDTPDPSWSKLFKTIPADEKKYFQLQEKSMTQICSIVSGVPAVHPPLGFDIKPYVSSSNSKQLFHNYPVPLMDVTFCNYPIYFFKTTHQTKESGAWGTSIRVFVNDPQWLLQENSDIMNNCDSLGIPYFYYRPEMHKDKNGYWVIKPEQVITSIRVIKKKGVPLYDPLTKKEYLEYKIKVTQRKLVKNKKELAYRQKMLHASTSASDNNYWKDAIHYANTWITDDIKAIREYQKALNTWTAAELSKPAFVDSQIEINEPGKNRSFIDLVSPSDKHATELVRLNRTYFDTSLPKGTPQLILIGAQYFNPFSPGDVSSHVKSWFDQIDYSKLQALIK